MTVPSGSVAVIFTSRRTMTHADDYAAMAARMDELVRQQPGFIDSISTRDPQTRIGITVAYFIDDSAARAWKQDAEHLIAQRRGATDFYEWYAVTVATVTRAHRWNRSASTC